MPALQLPCCPLSLINPPLVGKTFLAASSNQKELAPRRVKLFSCGILVLIARHNSSATINPREFPKSLLMLLLLLLPEPSRGNFWPSHRRAKYVYIDRGGQSQNSSHGKISVHTQFGVWLTPQLQLQLQPQLQLRPGCDLATAWATAQKSQFRTQIKIIESKCSNGSSSMVNALQTGLRSTR